MKGYEILEAKKEIRNIKISRGRWFFHRVTENSIHHIPASETLDFKYVTNIHKYYIFDKFKIWQWTEMFEELEEHNLE